MGRCLLLLCLLPLIYPGNSLKCLSCKGTDTDCKTTEVTCPGSHDKCATSTMTINAFPCKSRSVVKGCVKNVTRSMKLSVSPSTIVRLAVDEETCDTDFCNEKTLADSQGSPNDLYCHSCISPGIVCTSDHMKSMRCTGNQKHCLSVKVTGTLGHIADVNVKGCAEIASCSKKSIFSSKTSFVSVKCCDGNFCNSEIDDGDGNTDKSPNGVECYSCNTLDGGKCSANEITKCYGPLTKCLEVAGMRMEDGKVKPAVVKGCSTPDMCEIPFIPLFQQLGIKRIECCNGSLCNNKFTEDILQDSGAFPGTGDMNGYGSSSPSTGNHTGENKNNTSTGTNHGNNTSSTSYIAAGGGMLPTDGWSNNNGSNLDMTHIVGNDSTSNNSIHVSSGSGNSGGLIYGSPYNHGTHSEGGSTYNSGEMTPEGYNHGYNNAYHTYDDGGNSNGDHYMAPGGSSIEESYNNPNNVDSPHGNNFGYVSNNIFPEPNGTHGNYSNLILMLSEDTGISPALLSQRLNDSTVANPNALLNVLSNISTYDPKNVSPELKSYLYGNSNRTIHTYPSYSGFNLSKLPPGWDISNLSNTSKLVNLLANITGINPELLSQRLNKSNMGNHSDLAKELFSIPGFHVDNLPPAWKAYILGTSGSPNHTYSDHGANSVGGFAYNSDQIPPGDYNHGDSFGHDGSYGTYGEGGHNNDYNHMTQGGNSNEPSHTNTNHLGSSYGDNYVYGSNIPLPGPNGTHGNYSNLILMLSKDTGISPALLSQRLNDSTVANPNALLNVLSNISTYDPKNVSPELKSYLYGNSNQPIHTYPSYSGFNLSKLPPGWDISNLSNTSKLVNLLANITGINPELLSQRLNKSNMGNYSNLAKELASIPGFNVDNLPPAVKAYILGSNSNLGPMYPNHGTSGESGFAYNSDHMSPDGHGNSFGHDNSYDTHGNGEHGNSDHYMVPGGNSNETSYSNTKHPGSSHGNNSDLDNSLLPGRGTNDSAAGNSNNGVSGSDQNSASSLRSKYDVLAIVFTMTLLLLI